MDSALVSPELIPRHPHALTVTDVADELCVDPAAGLSEGEVERRRRQFGPNLIPTRKPVSDARLIARQFASPVVALLSMATAVSFVFGEWRQATAVVIVLLINAAIGYGTERRAVRSLDALRALGGRNARVRRGGRSQLVAAEALVPGDVVLFEAGDVVPADVRCLSAAALGVDESALTGESVPVDKGVEPNPPSAGLHQRTALMFKGTHVVRGSGEGIVTGTGASTELGRITSLVEQVDEGESPLEGQLARLSRQLIWLTVILAAGVAGVGLLSDKPLLLMVQTAIALAVAAIPEGLPIVATLALARGMLRMARRDALVEKLSAVETLGSTTVVLTDKTGTLTENRMAVERVLTLTGDYSFDYAAGAILTEGVPVDSAADTELMRALLVGVLCANADYDADRDTGSGDPMEVALLRAAGLAGLRRGQELGSFPEVVEYPFDASTKRMVTVHRIGDRYFAAVKGAPEVVLAQADRAGAEACPFGAGSRHEWLDRADRMAADGLRVLAVAMHPSVDPGQPVNGGLTFLGLVAFRDPARADIADAVSSLHNAGIRVVMATGDHPGTALAIARDVGIAPADATVAKGDELLGLKDASDSARNEIARHELFARVSPEQKLDLIEVFQRDGQVVAMIGDGVNDAPALTKADIGVAMGNRGTDVAREAADMVLLDDNFSTIVRAVREGRVIFDNIRRFSLYLLSCNLAEVLVVGVGVLAWMPLPLMPMQILFLNLVTDVFPAFALATGEGEGDVLDRPPRPRGEPIISAGQWRLIAGYGLVIAACTLLALVAAVYWLRLDPAAVTTVSFLTIALAQLWHVFNMRRGAGLWRNAVTGNRFIWYALALCLGLIVLAFTVPVLTAALEIAEIGVEGWALAVGCSFVPLVAGQIWITACQGRIANRRRTRSPGRSPSAPPRWRTTHGCEI